MSEVASIIVSGLGSGAVTVALIYSARQTRTLKAQFELENAQAKQTLTTRRATNDLRLMEYIMSLDRLFIGMPDLRPYFYDGLPVPDEPTLRGRVLATAEFIVDLADSVANMMRLKQLDDANHAAWATALQWYDRSPAVRFMVGSETSAWLPETIALLLADDTSIHPVSAIRAVSPNEAT
jgi:hypothetical protein